MKRKGFFETAGEAAGQIDNLFKNARRRVVNSIIGEPVAPPEPAPAVLPEAEAVGAGEEDKEEGQYEVLENQWRPALPLGFRPKLVPAQSCSDEANSSNNPSHDQDEADSSSPSSSSSSSSGGGGGRRAELATVREAEKEAEREIVEARDKEKKALKEWKNAVEVRDKMKEREKALEEWENALEERKEEWENALEEREDAVEAREGNAAMRTMKLNKESNNIRDRERRLDNLCNTIKSLREEITYIRDEAMAGDNDAIARSEALSKKEKAIAKKEKAIAKKEKELEGAMQVIVSSPRVLRSDQGRPTPIVSPPKKLRTGVVTQGNLVTKLKNNKLGALELEYEEQEAMQALSNASDHASTKSRSDVIEQSADQRQPTEPCQPSLNIGQAINYKGSSNLSLQNTDNPNAEKLLMILFHWIKDWSEELQQHFFHSFNMQQVLKVLETAQYSIATTLNSQSPEKEFQKQYHHNHHNLAVNLEEASQAQVKQEDFSKFIDNDAIVMSCDGVIIDPLPSKIDFNFATPYIFGDSAS